MPRLADEKKKSGRSANVWRHWKNGELYQIVHFAKMDNEIFVVYRKRFQWGLASNQLYVRPLGEFFGRYVEGRKTTPRFALVQCPRKWCHCHDDGTCDHIYMPGACCE
jgi:hypothetical protein